MKKTLIMAAALVAVVGTACSSKTASTDSTDSVATEVQQEEQIMEEPASGNIFEGVEVKVDTTGYTTTSTGLMYKEIKAGKGESPKPTDTVSVHYTGKHLDGTTFDSSIERGEPTSFPLDKVIAGWTEGVGLMKPGAKYQFIIPADLAYGSNGTPGGPIKPGETLYFEVELLGIEK